MGDKKAMDLYELLPALYRLRDAERGYPLRAFLEVIAEQVDVVKQDVDGLWDDFFIETCADWVIPYIGDLVGNNPLYEVTIGRRADVAKTIYYRRRKGTLPMLEELARDVTGWGAHAVQFFELLGWTQNLNHLRYEWAVDPARRDPEAVNRVGTVHLRDFDGLDRLDGPFDGISHTVDVRPISRVEGWHNIRNVGFFLWRLRRYPLMAIAPRQSDSCTAGYHFSPLGNPAPLFHDPQRETDEAGLAGEIHVPGPIRPLAFALDLERYRQALVAGRAPQSDYYGVGQSLYVKKDGALVPPEAVVGQDLQHWTRPPQQVVYKDEAGQDVAFDVEAAIDVRLGRLVFAQGKEPTKGVEVGYNYGFSADMGGGPYTRRYPSSLAAGVEPILVQKGTAVETIQQALAQWPAGQRACVIRILDNGVYGGNLDIALPAGSWLAVEAAPGLRPSLRLVGLCSLTAPAAGATLILDGLLVEGGFELQGGLDLTVQHCTLVPGRELMEDGAPKFPDRDSITVKNASDRLRVTIDHSIVGPLRLPTECRPLTIRDSIVHAPGIGRGLGLGRWLLGEAQPAIAADDAGAQPAPPTTLERVTIWGKVYARELTASEVIFNAPVIAQRRQVGCVRFSYVPDGSQTPRRYRCQPDLALEGVLCPSAQALVRARLTPAFTSVHYGDPGYAQLGLTCAEEIRTGAEDGSEMGAFCSLQQPQRAANLRIRLQEYLPFGLEAGLIYVT